MVIQPNVGTKLAIGFPSSLLAAMWPNQIQLVASYKWSGAEPQPQATKKHFWNTGNLA